MCLSKGKTGSIAIPAAEAFEMMYFFCAAFDKYPP